MSNSISTVIREIKHHRNAFMKKSTPYRQLNRAIKQLEKLEKIKRIILYDYVEKLEQIENIITETENQHYELQGKKVVMSSLAYDKIKGVIENG